MNIDYKKQGNDFLADTKTTLEVQKAIPQKSPIWAKDGKHGIHYSVTLKNARHSFTFDFWGSIADAEKVRHGIWRDTKPTAYNILTAINFPVEGTFEDFAVDFGYSADSIQALKAYEASKEQWQNVKKLFTPAELEKLAKIQ